MYLLFQFFFISFLFAQSEHLPTFSCQKQNSRTERNQLDSYYKNLFLHNVVPKKEFKNLLCHHFNVSENRLHFSINMHKDCSSKTIKIIEDLFLNGNDNCTPPSNIPLNEIDAEYFNLCDSLFQDVLQYELNHSRKQEINTLFEQSKSSVIKLVQMQLKSLKSPQELEVIIHKIHAVGIDFERDLFRHSSGIMEVWDIDSEDSLRTVIQLRRKIFGSDLLIIGTLAHEWGHILDEYFPSYFDSYSPQFLKKFKDIEENIVKKRVDEINADLWAGFIISHSMKNHELAYTAFSEIDFLSNFCQLSSSEMDQTTYYEQKRLHYLHPVDRALDSWSFGFHLF